MKSLSFISLLLVTMMVSSVSGQGGIGSCCRKLSDTQIKREMLRSYYIQHPPSCPIKAVVFTSMKGKRICSDPVKMWTQTSMAFLDGKNWQQQQQRATLQQRH